jgi:phosphoenolpyruvate phosphomutase
VNKRLDLVLADRTDSSHPRNLAVDSLLNISRIGKQTPVQDNAYEFVGIALFSEKGSAILRRVYRDAQTRNPSPFHESPSFNQSGFVDIIQEIIGEGHQVSGLEVSNGWIEIHERIDVDQAEKELQIVQPSRS